MSCQLGAGLLFASRVGGLAVRKTLQVTVCYRREAAPQPPGEPEVTRARLGMLGLLAPPEVPVGLRNVGQSTQVEQLPTGSQEWEGLVSFLCPVLKLDCFAQTQISICLEKVQCISPVTLLAWISVYNFTPLNRQQGKKNKINHFVHLMASLDRQ